MESNQKDNRFNIKDIALVGVMAAMVFAACRVSFPISLGAGVTPTRIHLGNSVILLCGFLLGGKRGGLAAGIGAFMFDMFDPLYVASAPFTLVVRFLMGWICGTIAHAKGKNGLNLKFNITAAATASLSYMAIYLTKSFIEALTLQKGFWGAASIIFSGKLDMATADYAYAGSIVLSKAAASLTNAVIGVVVSVPLCFVIRKAMIKANLTV